jgi:hypothetical protein
MEWAREVSVKLTWSRHCNWGASLHECHWGGTRLLDFQEQQFRNFKKERGIAALL